ncbi:MAG: hypothetical protein KC646_17810 [Candidatus Cloacimonetes bacterium]|nr:hypothetical protein [Candidatus Cloacimonadota bacterium]
MVRHIIITFLLVYPVLAGKASIKFKIHSPLDQVSKSFDFLDESFYFFDYKKNELQKYSLEGDLATSLQLNVSTLKKFLPFTNFKVTSDSRVYVIGKNKRSLFVFDLSTGSVKAIAQKNSKNDLFFKIDNLFKWNGFLMVQDSFSKSFHILSKKSNYLTSLDYDHEYVLPLGYDQILSIEDKVRYTVIEKISLADSRSVFFTCEKLDNDSFVSVYFLGYDKQKNVYLEKLYVNDDESKEIGIVKLSPSGKLLKQKRFSIEDFEFNRFDKTFLVAPNSTIYKLKHNAIDNSVSLSTVQF